jgi:uncharacterized protein (TIGR02246 family)
MTPRIPRRIRAPFALALTLALPAAALAQGVKTPHVPLRTALAEIHTLRVEYAEAYNKHDAAALAALYAADATVIRPDGATLVGRAAIAKQLATEAPSWTESTINSDTVRVFGNTAWDIGTFSSKKADGGSDTSRYLVILRRGMDDWKIASVAIVPQSSAMASR